MKQLIKKVKRISMLLLVISIIGCENDDVLLPQVLSGFTHTINAETSTVTFINTSVNARNYFWTFGDGTSSTEINPIKTYSKGEYKVTLKAINVAGASDTSEDTIVISDVGAPVITLLGDSNINIVVGGTFTDSGATAIDDEDGDISANIVVGGDTVDVNTAGTYIITYNVSDAAGNAATQRTRTVIVAADIVAPVITLNGNSTINVTLGGTFTDPGATASDNVDGNITSSIVVAGDAVNVNTAGTYTITYNVSDAAGNAATQVTRTVTVTDPGACTVETAQSLSAANYNLTFLNSNLVVTEDGATYLRTANPKVDAVNGSCSVGKVTNNAAQVYDNIQIVTDAKIDFNANAGFKMKVYSLKAGTKVTMKLEDKNNPGTNSGDVPAVRTKTGEWEELTFAFPATATGKYDRIVLFFDLESKNSDTYYFDDLKLYARTGTGGGGGTPGTAAGDIAVNGGFEDGNLDGWAVYLNGGTIGAVTTQPSTGTYCAKLFASAETGLNPTLKQERKGAGTLAVGDQVKITFDYRGALTGISGAYSIQSFVEAANGVNQTVNISVTPTASWQTYTTTYTVASGDISGGITLEFVAICGGVAGCSSTLYLDNISVIINP